MIRACDRRLEQYPPETHYDASPYYIKREKPETPQQSDKETPTPPPKCKLLAQTHLPRATPMITERTMTVVIAAITQSRSPHNLADLAAIPIPLTSFFYSIIHPKCDWKPAINRNQQVWPINPAIIQQTPAIAPQAPKPNTRPPTKPAPPMHNLQTNFRLPTQLTLINQAQPAQVPNTVNLTQIFYPQHPQAQNVYSSRAPLLPQTSIPPQLHMPQCPRPSHLPPVVPFTPHARNCQETLYSNAHRSRPHTGTWREK